MKKSTSLGKRKAMEFLNEALEAFLNALQNKQVIVAGDCIYKDDPVLGDVCPPPPPPVVVAISYIKPVYNL